MSPRGIPDNGQTVSQVAAVLRAGPDALWTSVALWDWIVRKKGFDTSPANVRQALRKLHRIGAVLRTGRKPFQWQAKPPTKGCSECGGLLKPEDEHLTACPHCGVA